MSLLNIIKQGLIQALKELMLGLEHIYCPSTYMPTSRGKALRGRNTRILSGVHPEHPTRYNSSITLR
jgi:hypothetical protein